MLSRREKLLVRPWEDRRFKDHRSKVSSALPAIDSTAPAPRPHVALKLKKWQCERDRRDKIQRENHTLLQRLSDIMRVNRLDNYWEEPPPNFRHKVGVFFDEDTIQHRMTRHSAAEQSLEDSYVSDNVKCYACETRKRLLRNCKTHLTSETLPLIPM